jgi:hypothetical protein
MQVRNKEQQHNQALDVEVVQITPSQVDENHCINTTIDAGSENKLNNKNISPLQWPNTPKRRVNRNTKNILFVIRRRAWTSLVQDKEDKKKGGFAKLEKKEDRRKRNEKTTLQVTLVLKRQMIKGNEL